MYFQSLPTTLYTLDNLNTVQVVKNIMIRFIIESEVKNNFSLYDQYDVKDGETPEIVADIFYNDPQLHWVILHVNEILDPRFGWVLSTNNLIKYCESKYTNLNGIHHYEDVDGNEVMSTTPSATPISNFVHEERLNEQKRRIKILRAEYVGAIIREFNKKVTIVNG